ncbi:MAG: hypothetical protein K6D02_01175 [Lachnospiraceae bacterium]|nr:hypothetical protein [Lachnospiraceae bacterium]
MTENINLGVNSFLLVCGIISIIYGARFFKKKALYPQIIVFGVACLTLGRLYNLILIIAGKTLTLKPLAGVLVNDAIKSDGTLLTAGAQIFVLSIAGGFLFFLTANFGQMDSLVDDRTSDKIKYRFFALVGPISFILLHFLKNKYAIYNAEVWFDPTVLVLMFASYFHYKHIFIPDVDQGIIRSIRSYNITALSLEYLYIISLFLQRPQTVLPYVIVVFFMGVNIIALPIVLERGVKRWTM